VNDAAKIRAAIEERKQKARDLGVVDNVFKLYIDELSEFPATLATHPDWLPQYVTSFLKHKKTWTTAEPSSVGFSIGQDKYVITFDETKSGPRATFENGILQLKGGETTLLQLACEGRVGEYSTNWSVKDIDGFIDGPWVDVINNLAREVFTLSATRRTRWKESQEQKELEKLKNSFGL
jgi:hypothetical protein